ncbi:MAG: hypothetical protein UZ04_CHB001001485 [Chlorobi bacterium OLB4]|jgi:hypothetical protein|nr:MAG: hypothetical protein UZ04_CHB001001485 [Chlorobi bacterium OLB4]MBV6399557.1 hypothetical protein [Ignavibacteria bacterium]RIK47818.1 MAG: hypothetical protein DCC60_09600 [Ignavibacteriota bacterium]
MILIIKSVIRAKWLAHHISKGYKVSKPVVFDTYEEALAYRSGYMTAKSYYDLTGTLITPLRENHKLKNGFLISKRALGGAVFLNPGSAV